MGRLLVLVALLGVMLALRSWPVEAMAVHDPLTLAAIGFVLLASSTAAEVGSVFKLPRVSGYIAAGVLLGPSVFDLLSSRVVEEMTMFNTLALGLIATGAGLELELRALSTSWKTLSVTVLAKILLSGGLVFLGFVGLQTWWAPLDLKAHAETMALALVLGTVSVGTSPAIVLAVINEMGARGRVTELALGAAVIKDFVLVLLLAIALAVGTSLLGAPEPGHGAEGRVAFHVAKELLGSMAVGGVVGLVIIFYVRFVAAEMLLFVAALVLAVAEVSRILHLDLLLVFITSGFVVRNFSRVWQAVLHALETVALPVFVVFFTIAGARIDLHDTYRLMPFALLLCLLRALGFYGATRLGGLAGGESSATSNGAFMAYLPQAGVTLGLLGIAAQALPSLASEIMAFGVAIVAINLAVGPVTLRRALQDEGAGAANPPARAAVQRRSSAPPPPVRPEVSEPAAEMEFGDPALRRAALALQADLLAMIERTVREHMVTHAQALSVQLSEVLSAGDPQRALPRLHAFSRADHGKELVQRASRAAREFCLCAQRRLSQVSAEVVVPCDPALLARAPEDGRRVRLRKAYARATARFRRRPQQRRVPLRLAARYTLGPRLSLLAVQFLSGLCKTHGRVLVELRRRASLALPAEEFAAAVTGHLQAMLRDFRADAALSMGHGMAALAAILRDIDSPLRPLSSLRYSAVEPDIRAQMAWLVEVPPHFERVLHAGEASVELAAALSRVGRGAAAALEREVLVPLAAAAEELAPAVTAARTQLAELLTALGGDGPDKETLSAHMVQFGKLRERETPGSGGAFRAAGSLHAVHVELRQLVDSLPEQLRVPARRDSLAELADPTDFGTRIVSLRAEARRTLVIDLMSAVDMEGSRAAGSVQDLDLRRAEAVEMAEAALEAALSGELGRGELRETVQRAVEHLSQSEQETRNQLVAAHHQVAERLTAAVMELSDLTIRGGREALSFARAPIAPLQRLRRAVLQAASSRGSLILHRWRRLRSRLRGVQLARHLSIELTDVHDLGALVQRRSEPLPVLYARLFRLDPLRDLRLSAAREKERARLLAAEAAWQQGGPSSALIAGDPGCGCTTLLNLAQTELSTHRLIRPEPVVVPRDVGLLRALAYELRSKPSRKEVIAALAESRTVVVLDDLGQWFATGSAALVGLREFLDLVLRTQREVFWVVSANRPWLSLVSDAVAPTAVFGHIIELGPLSAAGIRRVIETRHALSGMKLAHSESFFSRALGRIREGSSADLEFRLLHSVCGGNVQAALAVWARAVEVRGGVVKVNAHRFLLEQLPPLSGLDARVLALLTYLIRFGPLDLRRIADGLGLTRQEAGRYLRQLDHSGLLTRVGRQLVMLDPQHRWRLMPRLPMAADWRRQ